MTKVLVHGETRGSARLECSRSSVDVGWHVMILGNHGYARELAGSAGDLVAPRFRAMSAGEGGGCRLGHDRTSDCAF